MRRDRKLDDVKFMTCKCVETSKVSHGALTMLHDREIARSLIARRRCLVSAAVGVRSRHVVFDALEQVSSERDGNAARNVLQQSGVPGAARLVGGDLPVAQPAAWRRMGVDE